MKDEILQDAVRLLKTRQLKRKWQMAVMGLAALVVLFTIYILILPASTMTDTSQVLDCSLNVHEHTDDCYDTEGNLTCGRLEGTEHVHGDACFVEVEPATESAIEQDADASSADTSSSIPFSGEYPAEARLLSPEDPGGHAASVMTMTANIDLAAKTVARNADPYDLANYITSVKIQRREADSTLWEDIVDGNVKVDDELLFDLSYTIGAGILNANCRVVTYQIDEDIKILEEDSGDVKDGGGTVVGFYRIATDGKITITFNADYATGNAGGSPIEGHIAFESSVKAMGGEAGSEISIPFKQGYTLHVKNTSGDLTVMKTSENVVATDGTLDYKITVSSEHGTADKVILKDVMTNVAMVEGTLTVKDANGNDVSYTKLDDGSYQLPQMSGGDKYVISCSAKTTSTPPQTDFIAATNTVTASSKDSAGVPVTDDDTVTDVFTRKLIEKSGVVSEDGTTVSWTINLNYDEAKLDGSKTQRADISGWTLKDVMNGQEYKGEVTIAPDPNTGSGTLKEKLPYTFPKNSPKAEYTVIYTTTGAKDASNTATLSPPKSGGTGVDVTVQPGEVSISKSAKGYELLDRDANGDLLLRMDWRLTVDATGCAIPADRTGTLLGRPMNTEKENGWSGYWYFYDYAQHGDIQHYYTPEQLTAAAQNIAAAINATDYKGGYYIFGCEGTWENTDGLVLIQKGDTADDDFWDATYLNGVASGKSLNDGKKRNYLYVLFDSALEQGTMFSFDYSTTANLGQGVNTTKVSNHAEIHTKFLSPGSTEYQTYSARVAKYDSRKGSSSIGKKTEYLMGDSLSYNGNKDVLEWNVRILFPKGETYSEPVMITEALPEGLEVLKLSDTGGRSKYGMYVNFGTDTQNVHDIFKGYNCWFGEGADVSYEEGSGTVKPGTSECDNTYGGYTVHFARNGTNDTYTITVPTALANRLAETGGVGIVYIWAQMKDPNWTGIEESFVNTATVETGGKKIGEAAHEQVVKRRVISKDSSGYNAETEPNEIPYKLTINPEGADLVANSTTLTLTDILNFTPPSGANINARLEDVKIVDSKTGEDLTSQCRYTAAGETTDSKVTRTFTMTIPDGTPLTVTYTYKMSGTGQVKDFKNVATVEGVGHESSSDENTMEITVQRSQAEANLVGVNVYKVDGQNYNLHLNGAKFELKKWDAGTSNWVKVNEQPFVTETDEKAGTDKNKQGTFNTGELTANTAYCLIETEAPLELGDNSQGYVLDSTPHYFYLLDTSKDSPSDCMPEGFKAGRYVVEGQTYQVARLNPGDHIDIPNDRQGYELPQTGGAGTVMFTLCGLALIAGCLLYGSGMRRKRKGGMK